MVSEVLLFWVVLFSFLVFDNLQLVPQNQDLFRVTTSGEIRYEPVGRLEFARKELAFSNPLNLLDRPVLAAKQVGHLDPWNWRRESRRIHALAQHLWPLVITGYLYLAVLVASAYVSFTVSFGSVILPLLGAHFALWLLSIGFLVRIAKHSGIARWRGVSLALECLLVPAYIVNLNKILIRQRLVDLPTLPLAVRQCLRMRDSVQREAQIWHLVKRIEHLRLTQDEPSVLNDLADLETCLKN
jgi:hypothetical protein